MAADAPDIHNIAAFPEVRVNDWRESIFQLCWHQHGGSGVAMSYESVLGMSVQERNWWLVRIAEQREAEAAALSHAARGQ